MKKNSTISIIGGGGRVGLPLGIILASRGHKVIIIETDKSRINQINNREMPFFEKDAEAIFLKLPISRLFATEDQSYIEHSEICIVVIGTPVSEDGLPSTNNLIALTKELVPHLNNVKLLILRSTVYPGITNKIKSVLQDSNLNTEISFSPERIAEGLAIEELQSLPQIVGVDSEEAFILASKLFKSIGIDIIRTSIEEAELAKLFSNAFRYVNFAIANEFFKICVEKNIDWEKVWFASKHNYPRNNHLAYPGFAAGPCLVKDTKQLNYYTNGKFSLGQESLEINENLPDFIVDLLIRNYDLSNKTVGILGMTFKGNVDDFRDSLSFRLKKILEGHAKEVICSDEILQKPYFVDFDTILSKSDIIIIASPHKSYKNLKTNKILIDIWRISKSDSII